MSNTVFKRVASLTLCALVQIGCHAEDDGPVVLRSERNGVEVAEVQGLPAIGAPEYAWRVQSDLQVPTEVSGHDPLVYNPFDVLPLDSGRILVVDGQGNEVLVILDVHAGQVLARIGPEGQGPGELSTSLVVWKDDRNRIKVLDSRNLRLSVYTTVGELESEEALVSLKELPLLWNVQPGYGPVGEVWEHNPGVEINLRRFENLPNAAGQDMVRLPSPSQWSPSEGTQLQHGRGTWAALRAGIVTMKSDQPSFRFFGNDGQLIREVEIPLSRRTISEADIVKLIDEYGPIARRNLSPGDIALTNVIWPVDDSVFGIAQTHLWHASEVSTPERGRPIWLLFSVDGRYLGTAELPLDFRRLWSGKSMVWGSRPDSMGIPVLERLSLEPPAALAVP